MKNAPHFSVIVTAHNAAHQIASCLQSISLSAQKTGLPWELIFVDDRSTDGTADAAKSAAVPECKILCIDTADIRLRTARQHALERAVQESSAPLLLFCDADSNLPLSWASHLLQAAHLHPDNIIAGPIRFHRRNKSPFLLNALQSLDAAFYLTAARFLHALGIRTAFFFGHSAFSRKLWNDLRGFDKIGLALTEDFEFAMEAQLAGHRLTYLTSQPVCVEAVGSWPELMQRNRRVTQGRRSLFALLLVFWVCTFFLLPLTALAAGCSLQSALLVLLLRWLLGTLLTAFSALRAGCADLLWAAPLYEPAALLFGAITALSQSRHRGIDWGGMHYD